MIVRFRTLSGLATLTALLCAVGCTGAAPEKSGDRRNNLNGTACAADKDEEGAADKVVCSIDTDCDSDEVCMDGKCTGMDGEAEDGDTCADPEEAADNGADEAADDEGGADKINCSTNADCDADEACSDGKCQ